MSKGSVVRIVIGKATASGTVDSVMASGVLVAPDEVLTAAHVVDAADGGLRTVGYVVPGYSDGSASLPSYGIAGVHTDTAYAMGDDSVVNAAGDFAVIHLSAPVQWMEPMDLATAIQGGTFTQSGYPNATGNDYDESTGTFATNGIAGLLTGDALGNGGDPHGASGGPVWGRRGGHDAVVGTVSGFIIDGDGNATDQGLYKALTGADIATIRGWVSDDHPGSSATSVLESLGDALSADAAGFGGQRQATMYDVANALILGGSHGYSGLDDGIRDVASELRATATPKRELAYLAGMVAAYQGQAASDVASLASSLFPFAAAAPVATGAETAGYAEGMVLFGGPVLSTHVTTTSIPGTTA